MQHGLFGVEKAASFGIQNSSGQWSPLGEKCLIVRFMMIYGTLPNKMQNACNILKQHVDTPQNRIPRNLEKPISKTPRLFIINPHPPISSTDGWNVGHRICTTNVYCLSFLIVKGFFMVLPIAMEWQRKPSPICWLGSQILNYSHIPTPDSQPVYPHTLAILLGGYLRLAHNTS